MLLTREEYRENTGTVTTPVLVLKTSTDYTYDSKGNALTRPISWATSPLWTYHPTFSKVATETVKSVVDPYRTESSLIPTTTPTAISLRPRKPASRKQHVLLLLTAYTYDANGRIKTIDGPRTDVSDVTTYTYDPITGHLTAITQPLIGTTTYPATTPRQPPDRHRSERQRYDLYL